MIKRFRQFIQSKPAKAFILNREKVFIGLLNLDPRSFYENTAIGLVLNSEEVAGAMAASLEAGE